MSQFTSGFWDVYIAVITVVSIVACAVVLKSQSIRRKPGPADTTGHVWDEDLREYNNPLPRWWSWLFYITVVFGLGYLVLEGERELAAKRYGPIYEKFAAADIQTLIKNPEALAVGQKLFLNTCAQCHASDGAGSRGFPNLTDRDWQWGGDPKTVEQTITGGRVAAMPPWGAVLGEQGVKDVAHYVRSLSGLTNDSIRRARGEALFKANCIACHGPEGKGNPAMGAPNLGSSESSIIETLTRGRNGQMPAHQGVLTEAKIHLLTAYVLSLSQQAR
jgi:cytochrome c oxidase cbb3-type subunit 3